MIRSADLDDGIQTKIARGDGQLPPRMVKLLAALLVKDVMRDEDGDTKSPSKKPGPLAGDEPGLQEK